MRSDIIVLENVHEWEVLSDGAYNPAVAQFSAPAASHTHGTAGYAQEAT